MTVVTNEPTPAYVIESVVIGGDLSKLTPESRVSYYREVCRSMGLNPLTKPFDYITLNGRLTLYAKRDAADQLRKRDGISVTITGRSTEEGVYIVTAHARTPDGREDEATGAVAIDKLSGEARANAMMKAETKAKRRVTLSICGLGWLDETEVDSVPDAKIVTVDEQGEVKETHWVDDPGKRRAFYAKASTMGLDEASIKKLAGIEHIHDWQGTAADLLALCQKTIGKDA